MLLAVDPVLPPVEFDLHGRIGVCTQIRTGKASQIALRLASGNASRLATTLRFLRSCFFMYRARIVRGPYVHGGCPKPQGGTALST